MGASTPDWRRRPRDRNKPKVPSSSTNAEIVPARGPRINRRRGPDTLWRAFLYIAVGAASIDVRWSMRASGPWVTAWQAWRKERYDAMHEEGIRA